MYRLSEWKAWVLKTIAIGSVLTLLVVSFGDLLLLYQQGIDLPKDEQRAFWLILVAFAAPCLFLPLGFFFSCVLKRKKWIKDALLLYERPAIYRKGIILREHLEENGPCMTIEQVLVLVEYLCKRKYVEGSVERITITEEGLKYLSER